jgi:hypothetical protein
MTQEIAGSIMLAVMVLALGLAFWGWQRRQRRYRGLAGELSRDIPTSDAVFSVPALYIATTEHDNPLERVAAGALSYRAKAALALHPEGLSVRIPGEEPILFPASDIRDAGLATWTIDRVVEPEGMVMIRWQLGDKIVDSYFRIVDGDSGAFIQAVQKLGKVAQ